MDTQEQDSTNLTSTVDIAAQRIEALLNPPDEEVIEEAQVEAVDEAETEDEELESTEEGEAEEVEEPDEEEEAPEEALEEEESAPLESLSDFAEALELPMEELLTTVKAKIKVDGEESEVTLDTLIRDHQKGKHYSNKANELADAKREFDSVVSQRMQDFEASHAQNAFVLNTLKSNIANSMQTAEMQQMRREDPATWNANYVGYQDQLRALEQLEQTAAQQYEQIRQSVTEQNTQRLRENLAQEEEMLAEMIPSWISDKEGTQKEIVQFLTDEYKFTPEMLDQVADHRLVLMAYEAMQYRSQKAKAAKTVEKVKKAPKSLKPSKPRTRRSIQADNVRKLRGRLKKSGSVRDAASLIESTLTL